MGEDETVKEFTDMTGVRAPSKKSTVKSRKKTMKDAVEWLRNNDQDFDDVGDATVEAFTSVTGVAKPKELTRKTKKKAMKDAVEWLRNNDVKVEDLPKESLELLESLAPGSISKKSKKRSFIDGAIEWLRDNEPYIEEMEDVTVNEFTDMTGVRAPSKSTMKSRKKTM